MRRMSLEKRLAFADDRLLEELVWSEDNNVDCVKERLAWYRKQYLSSRRHSLFGLVTILIMMGLNTVVFVLALMVMLIQVAYLFMA